ncbi:MAG: putative zinc-binding protein [Candidatus Saccharibacteria bacterium]
MTNQCCQTPDRVCIDAKNYIQKRLGEPPKKAVISCEGGCIKGEVARVAANILAYQLKRDDCVRICLGDAATGNSGMCELVQRAPDVIAIEGCHLACGTAILRTRIPDLKTTVIDASSIYTYDREKCFEIFDMPHSEIMDLADKVAKFVNENLYNQGVCKEATCCGCSK